MEQAKKPRKSRKQPLKPIELKPLDIKLIDNKSPQLLKSPKVTLLKTELKQAEPIK